MIQKYQLISLLLLMGSGMSGDWSAFADCVSLTSAARNDSSEIVNVGQIVVGRYVQGSFTVELGVIPCLAAQPGEGCPFTCGDVDGSGGNVDLNDFAAFANCFGLDPGTSVECTCSDLDGNGSVDLNDFAKFATLFGLSSTEVPPNCS